MRFFVVENNDYWSGFYSLLYKSSIIFFLCKPVKKKLCVWIFFFLYNIKFFLPQTGFTDYGNLNLLYSINQYFHWMIIRVVVVDFFRYIYLDYMLFHSIVLLIESIVRNFVTFISENGTVCVYSAFIDFHRSLLDLSLSELYLWNQHRGYAFESSNYLLLWRMCKGG